ncbi:MAG: hypothetical protein RLZZ444_3851 [Pseudomonadota bacterium]|jgi:HlyD family secretion protein
MDATWIKRIGLAALGLGIVAAIAWTMRPQPALVDIGAVVKAPMRVTITQEGRTRVREIYTISTPITGHLSRTILDVGDPVEANKTVIAAIHPLEPPLIDNRTETELIAAREAARAAVVIAETDYARVMASLDLAVKAMERASRLSATGVIAESTMQKAAGEVSVLRAQVQSALSSINLRRAELESAEARLRQPDRKDMTSSEKCCVELTSPASGTVLEVYAKSEQPLAVGAKIADIGDPSDLEVVVDLVSADAVRVKPGDQASIVDWGGDRPLKATLRRIDPAAFTKVSALGIEEQRVNAVFDLDESDPRLGHGFRIYAEIAVWQGEDIVQVPLSALFRTGNDWTVFTLRDGVLARRTVRIDHMNDQTAEVLEGLAPDEKVVLHPGDTLTDGMAAEIRSQ